jgi:TM2 domain-containing membrane protein YozV
MRTVTVARENMYAGSFLDFDIYVDGVEYAAVPNASVKTFEIDDGMHRVQAKTRSGANNLTGETVAETKSDVVTIKEDEGDVAFIVVIQEGAMQGVPQLVRTTLPIPDYIYKSFTDPVVLQEFQRNMGTGQPMQSVQSDKSNVVAGILAIFLGTLGVHKFYLGYKAAGIIMLAVTIFTLGFGAILMGPIAFIEGIIYLTKGQDKFNQTYVLGKKTWF